MRVMIANDITVEIYLWHCGFACGLAHFFGAAGAFVIVHKLFCLLLVDVIYSKVILPDKCLWIVHWCEAMDPRAFNELTQRLKNMSVSQDQTAKNTALTEIH